MAGAGEEPASSLAVSAWLACLGLAPGPHSGHSGVVTLLHSDVWSSSCLAQTFRDNTRGWGEESQGEVEGGRN